MNGKTLLLSLLVLLSLVGHAQQGLALALKDKKNKTACDFLGYMAEDYSFLGNNALTALSGMPLGAHIQWTAWEEDGKKCLSIADNGPGASSAQLQALFDETLPVGIRNGLGLHVVRDMAKAIGCTVSARPAEGGGLEVVLIM